jgi:hypothetical protein
MEKYSSVAPNNVVYVKETPPPSKPLLVDVFERELKSLPGYLSLRYNAVCLFVILLSSPRAFAHVQAGTKAYVEFREVAHAIAVVRQYNGHRYHLDAPALRLDFDRVCSLRLSFSLIS